MRTTLLLLLTVALVTPAVAQLPPDAVDLALVKIPEVQKSEDLCPVDLVPSDPELPSWTHDGVTYKGSVTDAKTRFQEDPAKYASAAKQQRWVNNFMLAMSTIWCPITDEVTPGGRKQVDGLDYTWESCCSFCDEEMHPDNFHDALVRLEERAIESYELTGGLYTEGASSPVEGAIRDDF